MSDGTTRRRPVSELQALIFDQRGETGVPVMYVEVVHQRLLKAFEETGTEVGVGRMFEVRA